VTVDWTAQQQAGTARQVEHFFGIDVLGNDCGVGSEETIRCLQQGTGEISADASPLQHSRRRMVRDFQAPRFEGDRILSSGKQSDRDIDDMQSWPSSPDAFSDAGQLRFWQVGLAGMRLNWKMMLLMMTVPLMVSAIPAHAQQPNAPAPDKGELDVPQLFATTCGWCHSDGGRAAGKGPGRHR
jgi:hypothetical protein